MEDVSSSAVDVAVATLDLLLKVLNFVFQKKIKIQIFKNVAFCIHIELIHLFFNSRSVSNSRQFMRKGKKPLNVWLGELLRIF